MASSSKEWVFQEEKMKRILDERDKKKGIFW
jgi:hypothetical protein